MTAPVVHYVIELAGPGTVMLRATSGGWSLMRVTVPLAGLTPSKVANRFMAAVEAECLASCRAASVRADWPAEIRTDATLWQRFRDAMAQMPRERQAETGAAGPERAGDDGRAG